MTAFIYCTDYKKIITENLQAELHNDGDLRITEKTEMKKAYESFDP